MTKNKEKETSSTTEELEKNDHPQEEAEKQDTATKETSDEKIDIEPNYKELYQRQLAENENLRKRLYKEKMEMVHYAKKNLLEEFLNPLDQFEKALSFKDAMTDEVKNWAMGFDMILTQFKSMLSNQGIKPFSSKNLRFDPERHEAVDLIDTENADEAGLVAEEIAIGYMIGDKVLRHAKVNVFRLKEEDKKIKEEKHKEENADEQEKK